MTGSNLQTILLLRISVGHLGWAISLSQGLYLHSTTHTQMQVHKRESSGSSPRFQRLNDQIRSLDCAVTVIGGDTYEIDLHISTTTHCANFPHLK